MAEHLFGLPETLGSVCSATEQTEKTVKHDLIRINIEPDTTEVNCDQQAPVFPCQANQCLPHPQVDPASSSLHCPPLVPSWQVA